MTISLLTFILKQNFIFEPNVAAWSLWIDGAVAVIWLKSVTATALQVWSIEL